MRRAGALRSRGIIVIALVILALPGCGRRHEAGSRAGGGLTFEQLADTAGLSAGEPIVESFEAYRMDNGALRVKGRARLPDGARLHVAVRRAGGRSALAMVQVTLEDGTFDSPPMIGERGPLPKGRYAFEISAQFIPEWQPPEVLRATDDGRALRGPGMTRTRQGGAMLWLVEEMTR